MRRREHRDWAGTKDSLAGWSAGHAGQGDDEANMEQEVPPRERYLFNAILESADRLRNYCLDPDNRITLWNSGAEKLLGWSADEVIGRSGEIIFIAEDRAANRQTKTCWEPLQ